MWQSNSGNRRSAAGVIIDRGDIAAVDFERFKLDDEAQTPLLYKLRRDRALTRDPDRNLRVARPNDLFDSKTEARLELTEGVAIPVRTDAGRGLMFLEAIRNLSTDHIEVGEQIALDVAAHLQRHALLRAVEESAEARSRLVLARDLHDSVVQFLAGAAFRLEAMRRSKSVDSALAPQIDELKQLMLQEQVELRSFITALRSGTQVSMQDLLRDLEALAKRLSRQWGISCTVSGEPSDAPVPTRLHLDSHQLVREAVANAVRHAGSKRVSVTIETKSNELKLAFINDGAAFPKRGGRVEMPMSLQERVEQAGGAIELSRGMNLTKLSISLPIRGSRR